MITKGSLVTMALSKLLGDSFYPGNAESQENMKKGLENLEAMMAQWQMDGFDLFYNFAPDDVIPTAQQDSFLVLWMKLPVACNLAVLMASEFGIIPDQTLGADARNGMRTINRQSSRNIRPVKRPSGLLPAGEGNLRTGAPETDPDKGFAK
ncbi:TPA: packaged DNA stabilization gp4 family protein [Citrobacter gillenii]